MDQKISISDFVKLFKKEDEFQLVGLVVSSQSVWLGIFDGYVTESDRRARLDEVTDLFRDGEDELEVLTAHPLKDPLLPLLTLPCTKEELRDFVLWAEEAGCINKDECHDEVKKIISCPKTAKEIVEEGRRDGLSDKEIAPRVDGYFYEEKRLSNKRLGELLAEGRHLSTSGYVSLAQRARGLKK